MTVFQERADLLEPLEFKLGRERGRLAAAMDILSDVAVIIGTHAAYCRTGRGSPEPPRDIADALRHVEHARELLASLLADRPAAATESEGRA
jgi:hypothetical protein